MRGRNRILLSWLAILTATFITYRPLSSNATLSIPMLILDQLPRLGLLMFMIRPLFVGFLGSDLSTERRWIRVTCVAISLILMAALLVIILWAGGMASERLEHVAHILMSIAFLPVIGWFAYYDFRSLSDPALERIRTRRPS